MKEVFYEECSTIIDEGSATTKYNICKIFSIICYTIAVLWATLVALGYEFKGDLIVNIIFVTFPLALFICIGILLGRLKNKFFVEYDYTFITGTIKIAKVIRQIKRKSIFDFDVSNIEKIGMYDSSTYNEYLAIPGISTMVLTSNPSPSEGKSFYYIVANVFGEKKLLIFECTETFIVNIIKFTNKNILEEELLRK